MQGPFYFVIISGPAAIKYPLPFSGAAGFPKPMVLIYKPAC